MFLFADSLKKQCSCHEETSAKPTEKKATENKALLGKWMDSKGDKLWMPPCFIMKHHL